MPTSPRRRPPRPVADAPVAALVAGAEELAKGWLVALIEDAPLARAGTIDAASLVRDGPQIVVVLAHALAADTELGGVEELGSRVGAIAAARSAAESSLAVEALRAVVWAAVLDELREPDAALVAALAERLAFLAERMRGAALAHEAECRWPDALEAAVERTRRLGDELSLLVVEVEDAKLVGIDTASVVRRALGAHAQAAEDGERTWVIVFGGRASAEELAGAVAGAVRQSAAPHGVPLKPSIGVATLGVDADDAPGLIAAAEEASFAASARGIEVARGTRRD